MNKERKKKKRVRRERERFFEKREREPMTDTIFSKKEKMTRP